MLAVMLRRDDKWKIRFDDGRELDHVDMCKMETWIRGMGAWLLRRDCTAGVRGGTVSVCGRQCRRRCRRRCRCRCAWWYGFGVRSAVPAAVPVPVRVVVRVR